MADDMYGRDEETDFGRSESTEFAICVIIGAIKASEGTLYRYPLSLRLVS